MNFIGKHSLSIELILFMLIVVYIILHFYDLLEMAMKIFNQIITVRVRVVVDNDLFFTTHPQVDYINEKESTVNNHLVRSAFTNS